MTNKAVEKLPQHRPKKNEHVYNYAEKECLCCKQNFIHKFSIEWGEDRGVYKNVTTCSNCRHIHKEIVTKDFCAKINPIVNNEEN